MVSSILDRWDFTADELTRLIDDNPSLGGMVLGYLAELKLEGILQADERVTDVFKYDDHDRTGSGDRVATYSGRQFIFEVKSLQSATVIQTEHGWVGRTQVDASDRRTVALPDGSEVETTCLLRGEFDVLAVNLFAFGQGWRFAYAKNSDLPASRYRRYSAYQQEHLLATTVEVSWPPVHPFVADVFKLLDEIMT